MSALRLYFLFPIWDLGHNPAPVPGGENLDTTRSSENFSSLYDPAVALDFFQFAGKPQKIAKGTTLFSGNRKGMPLLLMPNRIYLLLDGEVGIFANGELVALIRSGEIFGEMASTGQAPRSASAVAMSDCRVIGLDDAQFHAALARNPGFALMLMSIMASRLRDTIGGLGAPASDARWRKAAVLDTQLLADLAQVLGPAARFRYPAGRIVMTEGELGAALFAVLKGRVAIRIGDSLVEKVGRGGDFGGRSLVDVGRCLDDLPIRLGKAPVPLEAHQLPQPVDPPAHLRARVLVLSGGELVEPRDQRRQHPQPFEVRVPQHQIQQLAPGFDAPVHPLVADALGVEQSLVEPEQRVAQLVVLGGVGLDHGIPVYRNRPNGDESRDFHRFSAGTCTRDTPRRTGSCRAWWSSRCRTGGCSRR